MQSFLCVWHYLINQTLYLIFYSLLRLEFDYKVWKQEERVSGSSKEGQHHWQGNYFRDSHYKFFRSGKTDLFCRVRRAPSTGQAAMVEFVASSSLASVEFVHKSLSQFSRSYYFPNHDGNFNKRSFERLRIEFVL